MSRVTPVVVAMAIWSSWSMRRSFACDCASAGAKAVMAEVAVVLSAQNWLVVRIMLVRLLSWLSMVKRVKG